MNDDLKELLALWEASKVEAEKAAKVIAFEQELRKKVIAAAFPKPKEGFNNLHLANKWLLKASCPLKYTIDEAAFNLLKPQLVERGIVVDSLVRYKIELEVSTFKALTDDSRALVSQALTIKPGSYTLALVAPTAVV